jgi:hypothetical protein
VDSTFRAVGGNVSRLYNNKHSDLKPFITSKPIYSSSQEKGKADKQLGLGHLRVLSSHLLQYGWVASMPELHQLPKTTGEATSMFRTWDASILGPVSISRDKL